MRWFLNPMDLRRTHGPDRVASTFCSDHYLRHNARRLEHLASLRIDVQGRSVLEVGAGIGDLTNYYIDRGCRVTVTDGRPELVDVLRRRFQGLPVHLLDLDNPQPLGGAPFDIVHCYGVLYHLQRPRQALEFLAQCCRHMLLLETCVSFGAESAINAVSEQTSDPLQALSGNGCRPTRLWVWQTLETLFPRVYVPATQPNHDQFPVDWTDPARHSADLARAVFIAARSPIDNPMLLSTLTDVQRRHE